MALQGFFNLLAQGVDARREIVFHSSELSGQIDSWADVLAVFYCTEDVVDNFGDFRVSIDLADARLVVGGERCLGNDDPIPVSELVHLLVDRVLPRGRRLCSYTAECRKSDEKREYATGWTHFFGTNLQVLVLSKGLYK